MTLDSRANNCSFSKPRIPNYFKSFSRWCMSVYPLPGTKKGFGAQECSGGSNKRLCGTSVVWVDADGGLACHNLYRLTPQQMWLTEGRAAW